MMEFKIFLICCYFRYRSYGRFVLVTYSDDLIQPTLHRLRVIIGDILLAAEEERQRLLVNPPHIQVLVTDSN